MENLRINAPNPVPQLTPKSITNGPQRDNYQIYNKECVFDVPDYGYIETFFLYFTITPSANSSYATPTSPYLINQVFLEQKGSIIAKTTTLYQLYRYDQLPKRFYDQVVTSSNVSNPFDATQTISMPLFFYTNDGQYLDPRHYKNLSIRVLTKGSSAEMGFNQTLTQLDVQLKINYKVYNVYQPIKLTNSYNIYQNTFYDVPASSTQKTINLVLPFNIVNVIFMLRSVVDASNKGNISKVAVRDATGITNEYDELTDFSLNNQRLGAESSTFVVNYGSRYSNIDFIKMNGNMKPLKFTIDYALPNADPYQLFVCVEYISEIEDMDGMLYEKISGSYM